MEFAEVVESVYLSATESRHWRIALQRVSAHCGARSGLLMAWEKRSGRVEFVAEHGLTPRYRQPFNRLYRDDDLRLNDLLRQPLGVVRSDTMLPDYDAYRRSAAYRELYSRLGTEHALGGFVWEDGARRFAIRVFRSCADGPFERISLERFERLAPHLGQAVATSRTVARARAAERLLGCLFEEGALPLGVFTAEGSLVLAGARAAPLLERHAQTVAAWIRRVQEHAPGAAQRARLMLPDWGEVELRFVEPDAGDQQPAQAFVLVIDRGDPVRDRVRRAAGRFGLTRAEARLVGALCEGQTLAQAASRFGVGRETVKSQLRDVFQKVGVRRQADLVGQVLAERDPN